MSGTDWDLAGHAESWLQPTEGETWVQSGTVDSTAYFLHYVRQLATLKPPFTHYKIGAMASNF